MTTTEQILTAAKTLGSNGRRVWLKDLRAKVSLSREQVDAALLALDSAGAISLEKSDNPRAIKAAEEAAKLVTPSGSPRHFCYVR